jgi:hypothetical protein
MGEIVAAQSPFSGCLGDFRRLRQRAESGHHMDTRLIRAKTPNRHEAQTCIFRSAFRTFMLYRSAADTAGVFRKGALLLVEITERSSARRAHARQRLDQLRRCPALWPLPS